MKTLPSLSSSQSVPARQRNAKRGFTLAEIMVALFILIAVSGMVLTFLLHLLQSAYITESRNLINKDMRTMTQSINDDARAVNRFFVYRSSNPEDRKSPIHRLSSGESGDMLVLVQFNRRPLAEIAGNSPAMRVVIYHRVVTDEERNSGPVMRIVREFPDGNDDALETILDGILAQNQGQQVVEISRGLADGRLFHNFRERSVMINAQLIHGRGREYGEAGSTPVRRITETYNFTVSPRG